MDWLWPYTGHILRTFVLKEYNTKLPKVGNVHFRKESSLNYWRSSVDSDEEDLRLVGCTLDLLSQLSEFCTLQSSLSDCLHIKPKKDLGFFYCS